MAVFSVTERHYCHCQQEKIGLFSNQTGDGANTIVLAGLCSATGAMHMADASVNTFTHGLSEISKNMTSTEETSNAVAAFLKSLNKQMVAASASLHILSLMSVTVFIADGKGNISIVQAGATGAVITYGQKVIYQTYQESLLYPRTGSENLCSRALGVNDRFEPAIISRILDTNYSATLLSSGFRFVMRQAVRIFEASSNDNIRQKSLLNGVNQTRSLTCSDAVVTVQGIIC